MVRRTDKGEVDILYNLLTYINASYSQDMYYTICYQVLNNIEKIPDISINELADLCYTSPATISRFCKALKCDNFAEFKKEVQAGLRQASHEIKLEPEDLVAIHRDPSKCIDLVYDLTIDSLIESKKYIDIHEIDRLCDIIYDAKKLHFFGFQFNKILASDIQFKLIKLGKFSYAFADRGDDSQRIELLDEDSVAIVLSVRARKVPVGDLVTSIKNRGAKVILITLNPDSEVIKQADMAIVVRGQESTFSESSISGSTVLKTFLDLLYLRYGLLYPRR
ncbi:MurR/RpiR family transcriptional regulator [uncultured Thomasclavelia sp.]|uniref:MurR/RpiR family transcriptional regulator n=1 Tax=uncultured Thomasclavelia sp. TaxID=3025759 RepID=UPI0025F96E14|nr:MurR/RpiR family transcriptional regulator [uncultured Thomasclavelia sp.]